MATPTTVPTVLLFVAFLIAFPALSTSQSDDHECARNCTLYPEPMTCKYVFTVEWLLSMSGLGPCYDCPFNLTDCERPGCFPINGVERPIIVINREFPGPAIEVCENDDIEVKVWNRLGNSEGTSIHWHGIHQRETQYMDGPSMITQCPISPQSSFTYEFKASPAGTHWWHSHGNLQVIDGAFGPFIVRQPGDRDPHYDLYDHDLSEHVVVIMAWPTLPASPFGETPGQIPAPTINGKGRFRNFTKNNNTVFTPLEVFNVQKGQRYRFRVIGNNNCHMYLSVEGHSLTVIATDGMPIEPVTVDRLGIADGERYDFVLNADQEVDNYWFRAEVAEGFWCRNGKKEEFAILRYEGAPEEEPQDPFVPDSNGVILNPPHLNTPNSINFVDLTSSVPDDERLLDEPDERFYFQLGWGAQVPNRFDRFDYPDPSMHLTRAGELITHFNFVSFKAPPSPLLSQYDDIPRHDICHPHEYLLQRDRCKKEYCSCTQVFKVDLNKTVELVLVSEGSEHPMHLHGYSFRVVGGGDLQRGVTVDDVRERDERGEIPRKLEGAILKDTLPMENFGYYVVRFVADNPGQWFFHCHDVFHAEYGMAIVMEVGEPSDVPPVPEDFPQCGSWSKTPSKGTGENRDKDRKHGESVDPHRS